MRFIERDALFGVDGRPSDVTHDQVPFSLDGAHISVYGAHQAASYFVGSSTYERLFGRTPRDVAGPPADR